MPRVAAASLPRNVNNNHQSEVHLHSHHHHHPHPHSHSYSGPHSYYRPHRPKRSMTMRTSAPVCTGLPDIYEGVFEWLPTGSPGASASFILENAKDIEATLNALDSQVEPGAPLTRAPALLVRRETIRRRSRDLRQHSPTPPDRLEYAGFPHIIERIIEDTPWDDRFVWRRTCKGLQRFVDKTLFAHIIVRYTSVSLRYPQDVRLSAPGQRRLPKLNLMDRAAVTRSLCHTKVLDWHLFFSPVLAADAAIFFDALTNLRLVRRTTAGLLPTPPAPTVAEFVCITSANTWRIGWWSSDIPPYGEGGPYTPGMKRLVLHIDFDPSHPHLQYAWWDESMYQYLARAKELNELIVVFVPCSNHPREVESIEAPPPDLGILGSLIAFGSLVLFRGGRFELVGTENIPPAAFNIPPNADLLTEIRALVAAWPSTYVHWVDPREIGDNLNWKRRQLREALEHIHMSTLVDFFHEVGAPLYERLLRRPEDVGDVVFLNDDGLEPVFSEWK